MYTKKAMANPAIRLAKNNGKAKMRAQSRGEKLWLNLVAQKEKNAMPEMPLLAWLFVKKVSGFLVSRDLGNK
jgi:hypothetical protein